MSPIKEDASNSKTCSTSALATANNSSVKYSSSNNFSMRKEKENSSSTTVPSNSTTAPQDSNKTHVPAKKTPMDFRFGKTLGEGSYSTVYLAKDIHSNNEYASE